LLVAGGAVALVLGSNHTDDKLPTILLAVPAALAFVASGIIARAQRPENATGILLVFVGFAWSFGALTAANDDYLFSAGLLLQTVFSALLGHLFLAFPTGRLSSRADRRIVAAFYAVALLGPALVFLFDEGEIADSSCAGPCPENVVGIVGAQSIATTIAIAYAFATLVLVVLVLARLVQRWRHASPALRRSLAPIFATAAALISIVVVQSIVGFVSEELAEAINWFPLAAVLAVPFAFLYGLLRSRFGTATRRLVAELSEKRHPAEVQAVLRRVLRDPELRLGMPEDGGFVDVDGRPLELPAEGSGRAVTSVGDEIVVHDAALHDQPELDAVRDAVHIALERGITLRSLESSERRGVAMLDAIPDNVFRVRGDGTFLEAHVRRNVGIFGGAEAFVGRNIVEVMPPDVGPRLLAAAQGVLETGDPARVEYELPFDGAAIHIEARIARSGDDEVVAITRDVTELKQSEAALRALAEGHAALTRVAVFVATAERPEAVFDVVSEEVARLLGADAANLVRFGGLEGHGSIVGKWSQPGVPIADHGTRVEFDGGPLDRVRLTGLPARGTPADPDVSPRLGALLRELGVTSLVAAPITVSGSLWGAVVVSVTGDKEFAADDEERIGEFANLVAVALATAEAREQLAGLAEGRAALSRVAVAVATATQPESVFGVVTEEVGRLFRADAANLIRFDRVNENEGLVVGRWSETEDVISPVGTRIELLGGAVTQVRRSGQPARGYVGERAATEPELHARLTELGIRSYVAAPIEVSGQLWGSVVVWLRSEHDFPDDAEDRLVQFGKLVSVALANAQAREELAALADEQAALSRVAVAVATEDRPETLFETVSEEVGRLFGARSAATVRYLRGEEATVIVGGWDRDGHFERGGVRVPFQGGAIARVHDSGRPERVDLDDLPAEVRARMADEGVSSQVAAPIVVSGRLWGATSISTGPDDRFPSHAEERLGKFTSLVAVALANAEAREELEASRARIVQAGDAERRRLERNLHDGAQQRLVALALALRLAQSRLPADPDGAKELLERASEELAVGLEELRELARGIHPAILTDRGLAPALDALAARASVPVEVSGLPSERLPEPIEAAAFYVVAESLTNVAKYASAKSARVDVARRDGLLVVEVADDGVGGADAAKGSGLRGLADRVEALGGRLHVSSEHGRGTTVRAELPV
jgi:signal transduction histidine kinase/PAS domain-containing protein